MKASGLYPLEISDSEAELGFRLVELVNLEGLIDQPITRTVAARILSSSDVLIKATFMDQIVYSHMRWGYWQDDEEKRPEWLPIGSPHLNAEIAIQECTLDFGEGVLHDIVGVPLFQIAG